MTHSRIFKAALHLAADHGWDPITLDQVAKKAKIKMPKNFSDKKSLLQGIVGWFDDQVAAIKISGDNDHEKMLEIFMFRFDVMQPYKKGVQAVFHTLCRDVCDWTFWVPRFHDSVQKMANLAGIKRPGFLYGLVYVYAFRVWLEDDDMGEKTMAALDRGLSRLDDVCGFLNRQTHDHA